MKFLSTVGDLSPILNYFQIGLLVAFIAIFVILGLAIIIGIFKGVFKSVFKFLMTLSLIVVAFLTIDPLVQFVGNFDLSFISKYIQFVNKETGETIYIAVTNFYNTLADSIASLVYLSGIESNPIVIIEFATSLSVAILKYVVLLLDIILIVTLGNLFISLLWHLGVKKIVPKFAKKITKVRWLSALTNGIRYAVVMFLLISPLTSIVNTINQSWQNNKPTSTNATVQQIGSFLDTYNNSLFAQVLFNWSYNENSGLTFEGEILSNLTSTTFQDTELSILQLLTIAGDLGVSTLEILGDSNSIDLANVFTTEAMTGIFNAINSIYFIPYLLPFAFSIAINSVALENIDLSHINFDEIDWDNEFNTLETILIDIANTGIVDEFIDENGQPITTIHVNDFVEAMFSDDAYNYTLRVFENIDNSTLLSEVMAIAISSLAISSPQIGQYLPCTYQEARAIKWGFELSVVYDNFFRINKVCPEMLPTLLDPQNFAPRNLTRQQTNENKIINLIIDNIDVFKKLLIGNFDRDGNLLNCNNDGYTISTSLSDFCLFDLNIFKGVYKPLVEMLLDSFSTSESTSSYTEIFEEAFDQLFQGSVVKNFKMEFNAIFSCLDDLGSSDLLIDSLLNNDFESLLSSNKDEINNLANIIEGFERSNVLTSILKPVLNDTLNQPDMVETLKGIGLEPSNFNILECENICKEMAHIVRALPAINNISELTSSENVLSQLGECSEDIAILLDTVFTSNIINPNFDKNNDNNFYSVLTTVFNMIEEQGVVGITFKKDAINAELGDQKWNNSKTAYNDYPRDKNGKPIFDGEIGDLVLAFEALCVKSELDGSPYYGKTLFECVSDPSQIGDLVGRLETEFHISKVFAAIERCALLKVTFGEFLDAQLVPFKDLGILSDLENRSFSNVDNWEIEGIKFARICNILGDMEINLEELDLLTFNDFSNLNRLLHALADTDLFNDPNDVDGTTFNNFLFDKLSVALSSDTEGGYDLLCDEELTGGVKTFNKAANDFQVRDLNGDDIVAIKEEWCSSYWIDLYIDTNSEYDIHHEFYDTDYISQMCRIIKSLDEMKRATEEKTHKSYNNYIEALVSGEAPAEELIKSLTYINNFNPLRMVIYHTFEIIVDTISSSGSFDVSTANIKYLADYSTTTADRQFEIDNIFTIYEFYYDEILNKGDINIEEFIKQPSTLLRLRDMLVAFNSSYVFHLTGTENINDKTAFQSLMTNVFEVEGLKAILYSEHANSRDQSSQYSQIYHNVDEKIDYMITLEHFDHSYDIETQVAKINEIFEVVSSIVGGPKDVINKQYNDDFTLPGSCYEGLGGPSLDFSSLDVKNISTIALKDVMVNLNNSALLHECLPNALTKLLGVGHGDLLDDIMSDANPYYCYFMNYTSPNYEARYSSEEIDNLILLIEHFKAMNEFIPNGEVSALLSFDDATFDLFVYEFEEMLNNLFSSNIFHQYKASLRNDYTNLDFELTSFENLVFKVFNDTGLYRLVYSEELDGQKYNPLNYRNEDECAKDKILDAIKNVSKQDYLYRIKGLKNEVGFSDVWIDHDDNTKDELHSFITFLKSAKALNISNLTDIHISVEGVDAQSFSPENINNVLLSLNSVDCANGSVGRLVKELMTASNMHLYSTYNGVDHADYFLSQKEYASENGIKPIYDFLKSVAYYDDNGEFIAYNLLNQNATDPIAQFVKGEWDETNQIHKQNSVTDILSFIINSMIYDHHNIELETHPDEFVRDDAVLLYNIFTPNKEGVASISDYIYGNNKDDKILTLNHLIHHFDYHPEIDGNAIDVLLRNDFNSKSFDASEFDSVNEYKEKIATSIIALTHEDGDVNKPRERAFIASEIFAGILEDFVISEVEYSNNKFMATNPNYLIDIAYISPRVKADGTPISSYLDICPTSYDLLNVDEANGIMGILDLYDIGRDDENGSVDITKYYSVDESIIRDAFKKMEYKSEIKNSRFASLIYISRLQEYFDPALKIAKTFFGYSPLPEYDVSVTSSSSLFEYGVNPNSFGFITYGEYVLGAFNTIKGHL